MIRVECRLVVIPKFSVDAFFPGGWSAITRANGNSSLFDEYLYAEGVMSPLEVHRLLQKWKALGLTLVQNRHWKDLCVVDVIQGPTLPCDWIEWSYYTRTIQFPHWRISNVLAPF